MSESDQDHQQGQQACMVLPNVTVLISVSNTLTLPVNIFTWQKEKPYSPGATKIFVALGEHGFPFFRVKMFTGSVCAAH